MIFDFVSFASVPFVIFIALFYLVLITICFIISWTLDRGYVDVEQNWRKDRVLWWIEAGRALAVTGGLTIVFGFSLTWIEKAGPALVMHVVLGLPLLAVFFSISKFLEHFKNKVLNKLG